MMLTPLETEQELLTGAVVLPMPRDLVIASGDDAVSFLNGQLSQAINPISVGASRWSLLLDPKGRVTAWLRVTRVADDTFWLDSERGVGADIVTRLNRFLLRTKVSFSLVEAECFAVRGTNLPNRPPTSADQIVVDIGWQGTEGFDVIGPKVVQPAGPLGDAGVLEALRIQDGVPRMGREFLATTIPAETGVVDLSADFTKGCYTGQELVARVNSRGNNTPRKIHRLTLAQNAENVTLADATDEPGLVGATVCVDGGEVGSVTSAAKLNGVVLALASIKRGTEVPTPATIELPGGVIEAEIHEHHRLSEA